MGDIVSGDNIDTTLYSYFPYTMKKELFYICNMFILHQLLRLWHTQSHQQNLLRKSAVYICLMAAAGTVKQKVWRQILFYYVLTS